MDTTLDRTASVRVIDVETAIHMFTATSLGFAEGATSAEDFIKSNTFDVGEHSWTLEVGFNKWHTADATLDIFLKPTWALCVVGKATITILNKNKKPSRHGFVAGPEIIDGDSYPGIKSVASRSELQESQCIENESLTVLCKLSVVKGTHLKQNSSWSLLPTSELHYDMEYIWKSGIGTDVTFQIEGELVSAHKAILAARSPYFKAQFLDPTIDTGAETILIQEMKAPVFRALLSFIYKDFLAEDDLKDNSENYLQGSCETKQQAVAWSQHLLTESDKFQVERLRILAEDNLINSIDEDTVCSTLLFATDNDWPKLRAACYKLLSDSKVIYNVMGTQEFMELVGKYPGILRSNPCDLDFP